MQTAIKQANDLTNQFLIAMPQLKDPNFFQSVTYVCEHSTAGALGITINRPLELNLHQMLEEIDVEVRADDLFQQYVYMGGPVHTNRGFVLHTECGQWESSLKISDRICLTTSRDILEAIGRGEGPAQVLVALGYAGWGEGQLEHEILHNSWLTTEADYSIVFDTPYTERWPQAAAKLGVDLNALSMDAGHA